MKHKIVEKIEDDEVRDIALTLVRHSTAVTNECFSMLSNLNKPETSFEKLQLHFMCLDEKVS